MTGYLPAFREEVVRRSGEIGIQPAAREYGIATNTLRRWIYPDEADRSRAASQRAKLEQRRRCVDCGAVIWCTSTRCQLCAPAREWTRERIIAAIQKYAAKHGGEPPAAPRWQRRDGEYPSYSVVLSYFGRWNDAIAAAGFTPRPVGRPRLR